MASRKTLIVINLSLVFIAFLLVLNFFGVQITPVGQAAAQREGLCIINFENEYTETNDLDRCCFEAAKQLECRRNRTDFGTEWSCQTGTSSHRILFDNDAYKYCIKQPYY